MNGQLTLRKTIPERLRTIGLDERWLQDQIAADPSILGLGEIQIIKKEKLQPTGGRIDFVMYDPKNDVRYEVEVMLGSVDESHIIRTIEYWDIERQRYPTIEHRAVLVAEEITSRFFNVIRLLNRAIPVMAIQLSAFKLGPEVVLHFTTVLDTYEFGAEPEEVEAADPSTRSDWEKKTNPASLAVVDAIISLTPTENGEPRITYNVVHIALGATGYNFCWFHPRRTASHCHIHIKVASDQRQEIIDQLEDAGIDASNHGKSSVRLKLSMREIDEHKELVSYLIKKAEEHSHR